MPVNAVYVYAFVSFSGSSSSAFSGEKDFACEVSYIRDRSDSQVPLGVGFWSEKPANCLSIPSRAPSARYQCPLSTHEALSYSD
jgi:hypothetical protein